MGYENYQLALNDGTASNTKKNVFWVAGVKANSLQGLPAYGPGNRLKVDTYNRLSQYPNIFAIGNTALMISEEYPKGHPQVVQPAIPAGPQLDKELGSVQKHACRCNRLYIKTKAPWRPLPQSCR